MPTLIDTHCHLAHGRLRQDIDGALARAGRAGVTRIIAAASDLNETKAALAIAREHEGVYRLAGIHPHDARDAAPDALRQIGELAEKEKCVAVGEIGLDYHYDYSPREDQRQAFAAQLELARTLDLPVVVHTREAFDDTIAILRNSGVDGSRVVMHSFTGGPDEARTTLDFGAMLSFSGIVTFKKAADVQAAALLTPADKLLVETDAPFLSPEPVRKMKTNEPANVVHVARFLADLRGLQPDQLAEQTTANACRFFNIDR
jgi:TatD DNase family protein